MYTSMFMWLGNVQITFYLIFVVEIWRDYLTR
jgi:hypothetical protein